MGEAEERPLHRGAAGSWQPGDPGSALQTKMQIWVRLRAARDWP